MKTTSSFNRSFRALTVVSVLALAISALAQTSEEAGSITGSCAIFSIAASTTINPAPVWGSAEFAGGVLCTSGFQMTGSGTLTLCGANTYTGGTVVAAVNQTTLIGGTFSVGTSLLQTNRPVILRIVGNVGSINILPGISPIFGTSSNGSTTITLNPVSDPISIATFDGGGALESTSSEILPPPIAPVPFDGSQLTALTEAAVQVPEPSAFALLAGAAILGFVAWRRRRPA